MTWEPRANQLPHPEPRAHQNVCTHPGGNAFIPSGKLLPGDARLPHPPHALYFPLVLPAQQNTPTLSFLSVCFLSVLQGSVYQRQARSPHPARSRGPPWTAAYTCLILLPGKLPLPSSSPPPLPLCKTNVTPSDSVSKRLHAGAQYQPLGRQRPGGHPGAGVRQPLGIPRPERVEPAQGECVPGACGPCSTWSPGEKGERCAGRTAA